MLTIRIHEDGLVVQHVVQAHESAIVVGRHASCDIVLGEVRASRQHVRIEQTVDGAYVLIDLGSSNGTLVNGRRVTRQRLERGDQIRIGQAVLYFGEPAPAARPAARAGSPGRAVAALGRRKESPARTLVGVGLGVFAVAMVGMILVSGMPGDGAADGRGLDLSDPSAGGSGSQVGQLGKETNQRDAALGEIRAVQASPESMAQRMGRINAVIAAHQGEPFHTELLAARSAFVEVLNGIILRNVERVIDRARRESRANRFGVSRRALFSEAGRVQAISRELEAAGATVESTWRELLEAEIRSVVDGARRFFLATVVHEANDLLVDGDIAALKTYYEQALRESFDGIPSVYDDVRERIEVANTLILLQATANRDAAAEQALLAQLRRTDAAREARPEVPLEVARPAPAKVLTQRAEILAGVHARVKGYLINQPAGYSSPQVMVGSRLRYVVRADEQAIDVMLSGAIRSLTWEQLSATTWRSLIEVLPGRDEATYFALAMLDFDLGEDARGAERLARALDRLEGVDPFAVYQLLADLREIDMPRGGFVLHDPRNGPPTLVTPGEKMEFERLERVAELLEVIEGKSASDRERDIAEVAAAAGELASLGPDARERGVALVLAARDRLMGELSRLGFGTDTELDRLKVRLDAARAEALELIFDTAKYPYPNPNRLGQDEVDELVNIVREIWENPAGVIEVVHPAVEQHADRIERILQIAATIDPDNEVLQGSELEEFLEWTRSLINQRLSIQNYSRDGSERARYEDFDVVERDNNLGASVATDEERRHVSIVNAYRRMMGRGPVRINDNLTEASRAHSDYMKSSGQFAHNIAGHPHGASPGDRAVKFGYGRGVGENIAMNGRAHSALSSFQAWYGSSGHHRNMLGASWRVLGAGSASTHWTQMFGGAENGSEPTADNPRADENN